MAKQFPAPTFIQPKGRLMPRDAGGVRGCHLERAPFPPTPSRPEPPPTESPALTNDKLFKQLEGLCHGPWPGSEAWQHSPTATVPLIQDLDISDILDLDDDDVAEPIDVDSGGNLSLSVSQGHALRHTPRSGKRHHERRKAADRHIASTTDLASPLQRVAFLQLPPPEDSQRTEMGRHYAAAIAKTYSFDLVYIVKLFWRSLPVSKYNASASFQLNHGQLLATYGLHLASSPLQISCSFHHSVANLGVSEYRNESSRRGEFAYGYALAFGAGHTPDCEESSVRHEHRVVFAGYRVAGPGGNVSSGLSEHLRDGLYLSTLTMVSSLLRLERRDIYAQTR